MSNLNSFYSKGLILLTSLFLLSSCGDSGGQISKGHRDAIKIQCEDSSDPKACGIEVRKNFIEEGNEFVILEDGDLSKDQIKKIKFECIRSKKYGLESYNNCLSEFKTAAIDGTLFQKKLAEKPKSNIDNLEKSTVYIEIAYANFDKNEEIVIGSGSGVIISDKDIVTNCHVAMAQSDKALEDTGWNKSKVTKLIWVKTISGKDWAEAKLIKKDPINDVCIVRHQPVQEFAIKMKPINKFGSFNKLKKGQFVRAMGSPQGLIGHTSEGSISWVGKAESSGSLSEWITENFSKDTKIIVHGAKIHKGSSGGPLFDKNGNIIGLNTFGIPDTVAENVAISADHIMELINK